MAAFGSVALYEAYYVGEAKLEIRLLYIVVGHGTQTPLPDDPTRLLPVDPHSLGLEF